MRKTTWNKGGVAAGIATSGLKAVTHTAMAVGLSLPLETKATAMCST
ncbi:MAG TPA: hypothetical protein VIJ43_14795 [Burkholderiales bacterium]